MFSRQPKPTPALVWDDLTAPGFEARQKEDARRRRAESLRKATFGVLGKEPMSVMEFVLGAHMQLPEHHRSDLIEQVYSCKLTPEKAWREVCRRRETLTPSELQAMSDTPRNRQHSIINNMREKSDTRAALIRARGNHKPRSLSDRIAD